MFQYKAKVTDVYDGDTITVDVDLGFGIIFEGQKIRFYGVNTPEVRGESREEGLKVRDHVRSLILDKEIKITVIKNHKKGKYGRWLGIILYIGEDGVQRSLNNELIWNGHGHEYN